MGVIDDLERKYGLAPAATGESEIDALERKYGLGAAAEHPGTSRLQTNELAAADADAAANPAPPVRDPRVYTGRLGPSASGYVEPPGPPTKLETGINSALNGATAGFHDEAVGILAGPHGGADASGGFPPGFGQAANGLPMDPKLEASAAGEGPTAIQEYRKTRDNARAYADSLRKANPKTALVSDIGGTLLSPTNMIGVGGGALGKIARSGVNGAIQAGIRGAGESDADLTTLDAEEAKKFAKDVGISTAVGGVVGAAGETGVQAVKAGANALKRDIERRILNEVAEATANTTPTGRKRLEKSGESIVKEVIEGPDGDKVRAAYRGDAAQGRAALKPILEKVAEGNDSAYAAFEKAGRDKVPIESYAGWLEAQARAAESEGKTRLAEGVRAVAARAEKLAAATGGDLNLRQLRGFTTEVQSQMSSVLGALNEHANAKVAMQVQSAATQAMDDMLTHSAAGSEVLEKAAAKIRDNNQRFHALLTIDDSLRLRAYKEGTGKGLLERGAIAAARGLASGGAVGAATAAASGDDDKLRNGILYGSLAGVMGAALPALARRTEGGLTTLAIKEARGELPGLLAGGTAAARFGGSALTRSGAAAYAQQLREEQEARRRKKAQP